MQQRVTCPGCQSHFAVEGDEAGTHFACPFCDRGLVLPVPPPAAPAAVAWAAGVEPPPVRAGADTTADGGSPSAEPPPPVAVAWSPGAAPPPVQAGAAAPAEDTQPAPRPSPPQPRVGGDPDLGPAPRPVAPPRMPWASSALLLTAAVVFALLPCVRVEARGEKGPTTRAHQTGLQMAAGEYDVSPPAARPGRVAAVPWVGLYPALLLLGASAGLILPSRTGKAVTACACAGLAVVPVVATAATGFPLGAAFTGPEQVRGGPIGWLYLSIALAALGVFAAGRTALRR